MKAKYWKKIDENSLMCELCPRYCVIKNNGTGYCKARAEKNGKLVSLVYGRPAAIAVDPIEKKPLYHFLPGSKTLSIGTIGCNMGCLFCQNHHLSRADVNSNYYAEISPDEIVTKARVLGCPSIALTYNDPTVFYEYAMDIAIRAKEEGIKVILVTAAFINEKPRRELYSIVDAINVDLKAFSNHFYKKFARADLQIILDSLEYICSQGQIWLEITNLLIPGENDSTDEIKKMTSWISRHLSNKIPIHFSAFHPAWKMTNKSSTPKQTLETARKIAIDNGLENVYTGNVHDSEGSNTYCPRCRAVVIKREGFSISDLHIDIRGNCMDCKQEIDGIF